MHSVFGEVTAVRRHANGDIDVELYHDDRVTEYRYTSDPGRLGNVPKEIAESMASTLATDICVEVFFGEDGNLAYIELEECEYDDEYDEDIVQEES